MINFLEFLDKIYYKLFPGSVYDQEERYIKENGYPKKSVVFADRQGRVSQLIGSETFIKNIKLFEESKLFKK